MNEIRDGHRRAKKGERIGMAREANSIDWQRRYLPSPAIIARDSSNLIVATRFNVVPTLSDAHGVGAPAPTSFTACVLGVAARCLTAAFGRLTDCCQTCGERSWRWRCQQISDRIPKLALHLR